MSFNKIKLSLASFDYYILRINQNINIQQVDAKLSSLRQMDSTGKYLVLEPEIEMIPGTFATLIEHLRSIATKYKFEIKFIKATKFIQPNGEIAAIPVFELPQNIKSKEINNNTLRFTDPVRSGMRLENDGDIVILNLVSNNAEIVSGGDIHVYGDGRGRFIAGNNGNKNARIFVQKFNAELISIAGIFRVLEDKLPTNLLNKTVQILLDEKERLNILPL